MLPIQGFLPMSPAATKRRAGASAGFGVLGSASVSDAPAGAVAGTALAGMLALQEDCDVSGAAASALRDRQARRRGRDLLTALGAVQRGLLGGPLGGAPDAAALRQLADLAAETPDAADPRLRGILAEIALRARVELARYDLV